MMCYKADMTTIFPRFQGKTIETNGRWQWRLLVTLLGDGDDGIIIGSKIDYATKLEALKSMMIAIKETTDYLTDEMRIEKLDSYIDMKTNITKRFDKKDEH